MLCCQKYFSRLLFPTRGWSSPKGVSLSQKGLFFSRRYCSVLQQTALSLKGLFCPKCDCSVPWGTTQSHKGMLCSTRDCSVPQETALYHKVLSCPLTGYLCMSQKVIQTLNHQFSWDLLHWTSLGRGLISQNIFGLRTVHQGEAGTPIFERTK